MQRPSLNPRVLINRFTDNDPSVVLDTQRIPKQPRSAEGKPSIKINVKSSLTPRFSCAPGNFSLINELENNIEGSEERPLKPETDFQKSTEQWPSEPFGVGHDLGSSSEEDNASLLDLLTQKDRVKRTALVAERDNAGASFSKPNRGKVGTSLAGFMETGTVGTVRTAGTVWTVSKLVHEVKSADSLHNTTPAELFTPDSAFKFAMPILSLTEAVEATTPPFFQVDGRPGLEAGVKSPEGVEMKPSTAKYTDNPPKLHRETECRPSDSHQADYAMKPLNKNLGLLASFAVPSQFNLQALQPQRLVADINEAPEPEPLLQEPSEIHHDLQRPVVEAVPGEELQPQKSVLHRFVVEVKVGVTSMPWSQEPVEVQQVLQRPIVDIKSVSGVKSTPLPKPPTQTQLFHSAEVTSKAAFELEFKPSPHQPIGSVAAPHAEGLVLQLSSKEESQEFVKRVPSKHREAHQPKVRIVELQLSVQEPERFELTTSALVQSNYHDLADPQPHFEEDVESSVVSEASLPSSQASLSPQASEASNPQPAPRNSESHTQPQHVLQLGQAPLPSITEESNEAFQSTVSVQSRHGPFDSADPINFHNILNDLNRLDLSHQIEELAQAEPKPSFWSKWFGCSPQEINASHKLHRLKVLALSQISLSPEDPLHSRMLHCFWRTVVGTQELVPLTGEHWRRVGFMDANPYAELRESGFWSLLMLLTILNKFPKLTHEIIGLSSNPDALFSWVAVGGRLTCMCVASLRKGEMNATFNKYPRTQNIFSNLFSGAFLHWARLLSSQPHTSLEVCYTETKELILKDNDRLLREIRLQMKEELS
jgi:hypothetical protein